MDTPIKVEKTSTRRKKLTEYTHAQLYTRLAKRKLSTSRIFEIITWVEQRKESIKAQAREDRIADKAWTQVIRPLSLEIKQAQTALGFAKEQGNAGLIEFYGDYLLLLDQTRHTLTSHKLTRNSTPKKFAKKGLASNDGTLWTDWIDEATKQKTLAQYNAIPIKANKPRRAIFKVKTTTQHNDRRLRFNLELRDAQDKIDTTTQAGKQNFALHEEAIRRLGYLPLKAKTPDKIEKLFTAEELTIICPAIYTPYED